MFAFQDVRGQIALAYLSKKFDLGVERLEGSAVSLDNLVSCDVYVALGARVRVLLDLLA